MDIHCTNGYQQLLGGVCYPHPQSRAWTPWMPPDGMIGSHGMDGSSHQGNSDDNWSLSRNIRSPGREES